MTLQRRASGPASTQAEAPSIVHKVLRSGGQPLDGATRTSMEPLFGHDFSQVRVHTDARADSAARSVNALAYTVGSDIVFATGRYAPDTIWGRQLLAHELTHTIQQGASVSALQAKLMVGDPQDAAEREADAIAARVTTGAPAQPALAASEAVIQRQTPGEDPTQKPPEKKDAGDVIVGGLQTVAGQVVDNNPQFKKVVIDPLKNQASGEFNRLTTGEKAATVGVGAAAVGVAGAGLLSDPGGRKLLSGVNLAAPLTLIPYFPITGIKYTQPTGTTPDKRLWQVETSLTGDDLINLRTQARGLPKVSLGVTLRWGWDPTTDRLSVLGADATLGLVPGLTISGGAYKDVLHPPNLVFGPEGQTTQIKQSIPDYGKRQPIPDLRFLITVDLLKFKPGDLARQLNALF